MKKFTLILATVALLAAGCSKTEVVGPQNRKGINFAAYTAKTTKALQTDVTTANLSEFKVTAFGNDAFYFNNLTFTKSDESNVWESDTKYFWPAFPLTFCAFNTPYAYNTEEQKTGFYIAPDHQTLEVRPAAELAYQEDLVAAYAADMTEINATNAGNTALPLTFNHYLTQVIVKARNASSTYQVVVDGVKIANMAGHGTYTFKTNKMLAPEEAVSSEYSIDYTATFEPKTLSSEAKEVMTNAGTGKWYLIPQTVTAWDRGDGSDENKMKNSSHGTYLALKVKITANGGALKIYPATGDASGWMAVPIPTSWTSSPVTTPSIFAQGKRYTIILDFFGSNGAGYVDPEEPSDLDGNPSTNDNGKKIIGGPIQFDATVETWDDNDVTITISL
ncbi:MAG: hypothetical protein PUC92_05450 [bacterium]|nr:hypothetical protein [bacterium]